MYPIALLVHITTAVFLVGVVLYTDHLGYSWMRGNIVTISQKKLQLLHRMVWSGLVVMLASGGVMFFSLADYLLTVPAFYIKMFFVLTLFINAFFIGQFMTVASLQPYTSLTPKVRRQLMLSGAVSVCAWAGALVSALFLGVSSTILNMLLWLYSSIM